MSAPTIDDIIEKLRKGEKIHLVSSYTSNSIVAHYFFGIGSILFGGVMFLLVIFMGRGTSVEITAIGIFFAFSLFGIFMFTSGKNKSEGLIHGDYIYLKSLMFGTKYKVRLEDISNIGLDPFQAYGLSGIITAAMKIMKTTVSFKQGTTTKSLILFNTKNWIYGSEISVADIIWVARDEARAKAGI